ncbi:MAG: Holliday junction branch migration DNA helicase RuvB [Patescibacteria group bacterium]|nr:Holliday junction branch migration DNA helicase RuvB [Patescibacteria group bacterium]
MLESSFRNPKENKDNPKEKESELSLRPKKLKEYVGQDRIRENLKIFIEAAKNRKEPLEHVLIYGPAGLGKTTLSHIIATEMDSNIRPTSGPAIEKIGDLASILTNLEDGDILFIDEIHRMNKLVEEALYPAMEDCKLDIIIGKGPSAKTLQLDLPRFTLIGATTRMGLISSPLRSRFGMTYKLNFYSQEEIASILKRSGDILSISMEEDGCSLISQCSRKNPRVANRLLKRVRDVAEVKGRGVIDKTLAQQALEMLEVDSMGLDTGDRYILNTLIDKFDGGPVGIGTLAAATSEERDTIEEIYEPYLLKIGFLDRTPRGRIATKRAYKHLGADWGEEGLKI